MTNISKYRCSQSLPIVGLALTLFCTGFSAVTASAATAQSAPVFGSVDIQKVLANTSKQTAIDAQLNVLKTKLTNEIKEQAANSMLSATDQQELGTLLGKSNPTDQDKSRISILEGQAQKDATDLATLQQVKNPTSDQTTELNRLTKEGQDATGILQGVNDDYSAQLRAESDKLTAQLAATVRAAIADVAQQKGLSVVFDAQVALYTANDITDDVTKRLNK